jgi:hypothetical protein
MSTENDNGNEGHDNGVSSEDWEKLARRSLSEQIFSDRNDLNEALARLEYAVRDGDVAAEDIRDYRRHFYEVQRRIEQNLVPLVDDVDPYGMVAVNLTFQQREELLEEPWKHEPVDKSLFECEDE